MLNIFQQIRRQESLWLSIHRSFYCICHFWSLPHDLPYSEFPKMGWLDALKLCRRK